MIVVTGAAGFIGSHLAERLAGRGEEVVGLDSFSDFYEPAMKRGNAAALARLARFRMIEGDIVDPGALDLALGAGKASHVIHIAARPGVRQSIEDPAATERANVEGTVRVIEACLRHGVPRLVFASSSSVYGGCAKVPFAEDDPLGPLLSPYAITKRAGEVLCRQFHETRGLSCVCLRFFSVYGPRQRPDLVLHKFARLLDAGEPLPVYGNGQAERDYTYVDDVVDGVVAALSLPPGFEIVNIGSHRAVPLSELVDLLEREMGRKAARVFLPPRPEDAPRTFADLSKASRLLGYAPKMSLAEGVRRFVEWFRALPGACRV